MVAGLLDCSFRTWLEALTTQNTSGLPGLLLCHDFQEPLICELFNHMAEREDVFVGSIISSSVEQFRKGEGKLGWNPPYKLRPGMESEKAKWSLFISA